MLLNLRPNFVRRGQELGHRLPQLQMRSKSVPFPVGWHPSHQVPMTSPLFQISLLRSSDTSWATYHEKEALTCGDTDTFSHFLFFTRFSLPLIAPSVDTLASATYHQAAFTDRVPPCTRDRLCMHQDCSEFWHEFLSWWREVKQVDCRRHIF